MNVLGISPYYLEKMALTILLPIYPIQLETRNVLIFKNSGHLIL